MAETEQAKESVNALYFSDEFEPALQMILGKTGLSLTRADSLDHTVEDDSQHIKGWVVGMAIQVEQPDDSEDETVEAEVVADDEQE